MRCTLGRGRRASGWRRRMNRYDHLGRRVQKIAPDGTHTFLYDGWRPVVEMVARPGGGTDRIEYYWGKDLSGSLDGAAGVGGLLYVKRNGAIYVPFCDAFGNVMGYWDENGAVVAEYAYDAFGRTVAKSGTMADMFAIRYSTKYYDAETGMYYYGKRYYLAVLCRWLTRDPIEEQGGVNLYGFCGNDGVTFVDPLGELFYVVKHFPTISPPGGWLTPCARAETVFIVPRYRIKEKNDVGGKIRFEIDLVPEDMRVDVYFRSGASSIWSMAYEYDHIAYARQMYHAALILKKAILDICDCPVPARKAKVVLEDEFKMAIKQLIRENAALDRKGGKHDLPYRKSPFGDN